MTADLESYWVTIHVRLHQPLETDEGETVVGYYRHFGLRSTATALREAILAEAQDGVVDWEDTTTVPLQPAQAHASIAPYVVADERVWYRSGRILYWND